MPSAEGAVFSRLRWFEDAMRASYVGCAEVRSAPFLKQMGMIRFAMLSTSYGLPG